MARIFIMAWISILTSAVAGAAVQNSKVRILCVDENDKGYQVTVDYARVVEGQTLGYEKVKKTSGPDKVVFTSYDECLISVAKAQN